MRSEIQSITVTLSRREAEAVIKRLLNGEDGTVLYMRNDLADRLYQLLEQEFGSTTVK